MDKTIARRISYCILIALFFVLIFLSVAAPVSARADFSSYVLDDLSKNPSFNVNDYAVNQTDFSLEVLQLAEGNDKSLLVYVYQPSAGKNDMKASKITMSVGDVNGQPSYSDYTLTFVNSSGVFYKYKVDNYVVDPSSTMKRSYKVTKIVRPASEDFGDTLVDEHNVTWNAISYPVNWEFTAVVYQGGYYFGKQSMIEKTVIVNDMYCGQLIFQTDPLTTLSIGALGFNSTHCTLHFIAFNSPAEIDDLCGAKVCYNLHDCYILNGAFDDDEQEIVSYEEKLLSKTAHDSHRGGIFAHKYQWDEIMSKDDFVNNVCTNSSAFFRSDMTEGGASDLADKEWVLCFLKTNYSSSYSAGNVREHYKYVSDETILELHYFENGELVVHGVVANYGTGDGISDIEEDYGVNGDWWKEQWEKLKEWLKIAAIVIAVILLCVVLGFLSPVFKGIWLVVSFSFKLIFGARKRRKERQREKKIDDLIEASSRSKSSYRYRR